MDSWKFSMLLLYMLWDDWPIFMISGSNEQLQQELEYTLLKPDCYSWWISKMQSGREDTLEEQYAIKFCFKLGKTYLMILIYIKLSKFRIFFLSYDYCFESNKKFTCLNLWDEVWWIFYHSGFSDYCLFLYCHIHISANVSSVLLQVFLVKLKCLQRTLNHVLYSWE